jgi:hypothetical protein
MLSLSEYRKLIESQCNDEAMTDEAMQAGVIVHSSIDNCSFCLRVWDDLMHKYRVGYPQKRDEIKGE